MVSLKYDNENKRWREVNNGETPDLVIDGYLKTKLDNLKMIVDKNWDGVFIIVGEEGSGKSTLSFICGQYLSGMGLTMANLAEGSDDAINKLKTMPDGSILICDEAELLFSSRETMSREQKQLTQIMKVIRQKNMILILVSPVFFDLSKYIAVDRARFLLRCYTDANLNRGFFMYWGKKKKLKLYQEGKKRYGSYGKPKADFFGRFSNYLLPFDDEYQMLKKRSLNEAFEGKKGAYNESQQKLLDKMTKEATKRACENLLKIRPDVANSIKFRDLATSLGMHLNAVEYLSSKLKPLELLDSINKEEEKEKKEKSRKKQTD